MRRFIPGEAIPASVSFSEGTRRQAAAILDAIYYIPQGRVNKIRKGATAGGVHPNRVCKPGVRRPRGPQGNGYTACRFMNAR